jgi:putative aldouronate transport system substrate-binding protein
MVFFKKKKLVLMLLVFILSFSTLLAACTIDKKVDVAATPNGSASDKPLNHADLAKKKFDPPVTITTAIVEEKRDNNYKPGESMENNVNTKWMKENMGIDLKFDFVVSKQADFNTKMSLLLASNEKLPDVFASGPTTNDLIDAGKLLQLNEAIEKYASPNLKKLYAKFPQALDAGSRDGKIYGIPIFKEADEGAVMWIREDWLKKLNLTAPKTIAELEIVLEAFTKKDPDGNSKDDTFGLAVSLKNGMYTWMATADPIVGAFSDYMAPESNSIGSYWNPDKTGKLVYSAVDPSMKPFLETMARWKKNGLMDPEAAIKDATKAVEPAVKGSAGVVFGPNWMGQFPLEDTAKANPNAVWKPYPIPAGPDGKIGRVSTLTLGQMVFSKDFKHIDAWFAYMNKMYARQFGKDDPYWDPKFEVGYHEGYDYIIHEGKVIKNKFEAYGVPKDKWPLASGKEIAMFYTMFALNGGSNPTVPYLGDPGYKKFMDDPNAPAANPAEDRVKWMIKSQIEAGLVRQSQPTADKFNSFQGPASETMKAKGGLISKLESEAYLKIIYGDKPIDYFDEFVKEWKANGGDQITTDVNKWYDSTKKK